jgi:hypothetical protein
MIYLPQSLLLVAAGWQPVIVPRLGTTSKRCVESRNTRVAGGLLRARFCRCCGGHRQECLCYREENYFHIL